MPVPVYESAIRIFNRQFKKFLRYSLDPNKTRRFLKTRTAKNFGKVMDSSTEKCKRNCNLPFFFNKEYKGP